MIDRADQLREVREAAGLTLTDVAQRLRLSARHLEAIEAANWERLPGSAFTRGALRSYARLLSVDVEPLLGQLPSANSPELLRPAPTLETQLPRRGAGLGFRTDSAGALTRWVVLGCVVLAVIAALLLWPETFQGLRESVRARQAESLTVSPEAASVAVARSPSAAAPGAVSEQTDALRQSDPAAPREPSRPESASAPATQSPAATPSPVVMPTAWPARLVVTARRDSWVEVRDATDRVLHMGLVRPAAALTLALQGPVTYTVGNSASTVLEFAGQTINLAAHTQPGTNIAKGSLP